MTRRAAALCLLLLTVHAVPRDAVAQPPPAPPPVERPDATPPAGVVIEDAEIPPPPRGQPAVRIGSDYTLAAGDSTRDVAVVSGSATIAGHVFGDVVVVLGQVRLAGTAVIDGDLVVVGGSAAIESGATVDHDLIVIGGALDAPAGFSPGGEHVAIGSQMLGGDLQALVPWITRGLMWGRLIVPDVVWVWAVVGGFFLLYLLINLVAERPVRACAEVIAAKPLTTFLMGLLVLLLSGPLMLLLTVSVVGIIVIPFVVCALLLAALVGRVGVARWLGMRIVAEDEPTVAKATRSFVIGFAVLCLGYMIPVLGLILWASVGVLAIGAGVASFLDAYRRENPAPPRVEPPIPSAPSGGLGTTPSPGIAQAAYEAPLSDIPPQPTFVPPADARPSPQPAAAISLTGFPFAPFRDRLMAFILDIIIVLIASAMLDLGRNGPRRFLMLLLIYHIAFWTWKATTVGGIICQLRVTLLNGERPRFVDALVRGLSSILSLAALGLGALWILKDPERQAWHDRIAGTYVVKVPRHYPV
ncbi:MAG TPA: RDD family protein [Vicinamibacterales bacterium]|nr:RDD family protein [Vicinamibacterales bacterium]